MTTMLALPRSIPRRVGLLALAVFFVVAGIGHFTNPEFYVSIIPTYLPSPRELVFVSGIFEITGGIAVLVPSARRWAGLALVALLVAVFPANLHMALNPDAFLSGGASLWMLYARLPLQLVLMAWAYWATRPDALAQEISGE